MVSTLPYTILNLPLNDIMEYKDYLVTARSENDEVKAIAITSKNLVDYKRVLFNLSPICAAASGRLMSAALMMGNWLKNESDTICLEIVGDGELNHLDAIANNRGEVRSYISKTDIILPPNAANHLNVGGAIGKGHLVVIRDLGLKTPYVSQVDLQTGEIAEDLAFYFAKSEQTPTAIGLGVHFNKETVTVDHAGGYIVQLMPNTSEETIKKLEENLSNTPAVTQMLIENGDSPEKILEYVLAGLSPKFETTRDVCWKCNCSHERGLRIISSLSLKELKRILDEKEPVNINCNFCGKTYKYSENEIKDIIDKKENKDE